ncbi:ABC transporter ATP-binding protein [Nocardiopsis prasina]|uniref:ABC transporter ATP-binding protein n=1 Tax=Nocardiopsis prasina TaxID=2015 RepID=UPI001267F799|nr:ABC transporter ATP-binding protein [Nocardiopsis prasina]
MRGATEEMEQGVIAPAEPDPTPRGERVGTFMRLAVWVLVLAFPLTLLMSALGGSALADQADQPDQQQDDEIAALSFYRLSSSMTALFSTAQEPGEDVSFEDSDEETGWITVLDSPANAGAMLGYADQDYNPIAGWFNSSTAQSSDSVGYNTLLGSSDAGSSGAHGARDFALFGATLNGLGLDNTSTGLSIGFFNAFLGGIIFLLYTASAAVDALWRIIIEVLVFLNPFKLFYGAISRINPAWADGMTGGEGPPEFLGSLFQWVNSWYLALIHMSWTVMVPLFVGTFLMGALMFQRFKGPGLKKLLIRLFFIVLGVPLLGSMYTGMLESMQFATKEGNTGSTRVVLSTYVDFEGWATQQRLRVPDQSHDVYIEWDQDRQSPTGRSQASVRDLALLINAQVLGLERQMAPTATDDDQRWNDSALASDGISYSQTQYGEITDILFRYMGNSHVSASSFETQAKSTLSGDAKQDARDWFEDYTGKPKDLVGLDEVKHNPLLTVADGTGLQAESSGSGWGTKFFDWLWQRENQNDSEESTRTLAFSTEGSSRDCGLEIADNSGRPIACNLSPLAMYNYLNTDFGPTSYTSYSSGRTTSEATRSIHNSVNLVGTGTMSFVYWINAVVLLGAFITIGFGYAIAMIVGNIRRSFQLIMAIPFATLGVISGIAKVIVYTIALIMEVVVTLFLYKFVQEFLLSLPRIIEAPLSGALDGGADEVGAFLLFLQAGGFLTMVIALISIIMIVLFTVMAMRLRKTMVKAVEDASSKLVEKFTDSSAQPGGGKMPSTAGAGGKGSGATASNRMGGASSAKGGAGMNAGGASGGAAGGTAAASGGTDSTVSGDVDTDGKLEGPAGMFGDDRSGSGLGTSEQDQNAAEQARLGRQVETDGLSDDPLETMAGSAQQSAAGYMESDKHRIGAAGDAAKATGHAAIAVGRGVAGDGAGAAKSAGDATAAAGSAVSRNAEASKASQQASQSTLDAPKSTARQDRQIQQGQQMQQAGKTVSNVAGMAGTGTGGGSGGGGGTPKTPKPAPKQQPRPQKQPPKPPKQPKPRKGK